MTSIPYLLHTCCCCNCKCKCKRIAWACIDWGWAYKNVVSTWRIWQSLSIRGGSGHKSLCKVTFQQRSEENKMSNYVVQCEEFSHCTPSKSWSWGTGLWIWCQPVHQGLASKLKLQAGWRIACDTALSSIYKTLDSTLSGSWINGWVGEWESAHCVFRCF